MVRKHDDGDVEAFFDQAPGHVSPEDKKLHRVKNIDIGLIVVADYLISKELFVFLYIL